MRTVTVAPEPACLLRVLDRLQAAEVDRRSICGAKRPDQSALDADRHWRTARNRRQGGGEAVIDEHGRVHAVGEVAQFVDRLLGVGAQLAE
jgi:hypothetical protein